MKARQTLINLATTLAVEIEEHDDLVVEMLAPIGKVFNANGLHCYCSPNMFGQTRWLAAQYQDCLNALRMGLSDCAEPNCDVCNGW